MAGELAAPPRKGEEEMRARTAAIKPNAAAMQLSAAGTTSCRAPRARPPSGKWESMAAKPKGRALRCSPIRGMSRRSSAITAARFSPRHGWWARSWPGKAHLGPRILVQNPLDIHCMFLLKDNRTKQEQCQGRIGPAVISLSHQDLAPEARSRQQSAPPHRGSRIAESLACAERMTGCRCLSLARR